MSAEAGRAAGELVDHLTRRRGVSAAVVGTEAIDMTPVVESLIAAGWTYEGAEYVGGKRVRYLTPPDGWTGDDET